MINDLEIGASILKQKERIEDALCYLCKTRVCLNRFQFGMGADTKYQCNRCGKIFDKTNFQKLIEFNEEWQGVPLTGNEYWDHVTQKKRVHDILTKDKWNQVEYEYKIHCRNPHSKLLNKHPYFLDVFAGRNIDGRYVMVGVEINNEKPGGGHGSKITIPQDRNRAEDIWDQFRIKVIPFNLDHMKAAEDSDILKEIYQNIDTIH